MRVTVLLLQDTTNAAARVWVGCNSCYHFAYDAKRIACQLLLFPTGLALHVGAIWIVVILFRSLFLATPPRLGTLDLRVSAKTR